MKPGTLIVECLPTTAAGSPVVRLHCLVLVSVPPNSLARLPRESGASRLVSPINDRRSLYPQNYSHNRQNSSIYFEEALATVIHFGLNIYSTILGLIEVIVDFISQFFLA